MENYLKTLVDFYPVSSDQNKVLQLLQYIQTQCQSRGLLAEMLTFGNVHNLYVTRNGQKHVKVLLQAHVDVVPGEGQPFRSTPDKYEGRGTFDMLFAAACYLQLIDDLKDQLANLDFGIFLSGDEELSGENGVGAFLAAGYTTDVCILPDAGDGYGSLSIGAKGIYELTVRINGRSHHGSRPWEGDGAAAKLVHFLAEAEQLFDTSARSNSTLTISRLLAGDVANRGPATAEASLDIRYENKLDLARIQQGLDTLLTRHDGEIVDTLEGDDYSVDVTNKYVATFIEQYSAQIGKDVELTVAPGSSDARFFTKSHTPVIMLRPDGGGAHGDNEWVSRSSLIEYYQLLKQYLLTVAKEQ